jgi:acyl carrier protein
MNRSLVLEKLQSIFDDVFLEPVTVAPELSAHDVPEWNSLLHISLMVAVEQSFGIRFNVGEVENTQNIGEFADLIVHKLGK